MVENEVQKHKKSPTVHQIIKVLLFCYLVLFQYTWIDTHTVIQQHTIHCIDNHVVTDLPSDIFCITIKSIKAMELIKKKKHKTNYEVLKVLNKSVI